VAKHSYQVHGNLSTGSKVDRERVDACTHAHAHNKITSPLFSLKKGKQAKNRHT
jgi:hypothetical protein